MSRGKRVETRGTKTEMNDSAPVRRRSRKGRRRKRLALLVTFMAVAILTVGAYFLWHSFRPPDFKKEPEQGAEVTVGPMPSGMEGKGGKITMLLAGENDDANSDTIMVATIDTKEKKVGILSIPRDTGIDTGGGLRKINSSFGIGSQGGSSDENRKAGFNKMRQDVTGLVGFTPNYYLGVQMEGFVELVDQIGGVEFDVPVDMKKGIDPSLGMKIDLRAGPQTLNGEKALMLVRFRGYPSGSIEERPELHDDYARVYIQQKFLKVLLKKAKESFSLNKIKPMLAIAEKNLHTNLKSKNMLWLAQALYSWGADSISFSTLPTVAGSGSYLAPDPEKALSKVNELINPYNMDITSDMVHY